MGVTEENKVNQPSEFLQKAAIGMSSYKGFFLMRHGQILKMMVLVLLEILMAS